MRLSRLAVPFLLAFAAPAVADDTADFLKPDNWEGLKELWTVKDGTVVGFTGKDGIKSNTFLVSKQMYGDFEMSFQVRLKNGVGNSGIQIRSTLLDKAKFVVGGPQADIGAGYWGSLYGERVGGMMKQSTPAQVKKVVKDKEFNDYSIRCVGNHVTIKINGETMVDGEFPTLPEKVKDGQSKKKMPAEGVIAFQAHAGPSMEVTYKNIKFHKITSK